MQLSPAILIHMTAAIGALVTGPVALWARKGATQRPVLHRAFGYAWVTLMVITAVSAMFIRDTRLPNILGYTPIHLFVPATLFGLFGAFYYLAKRNIAQHKATMQRLFWGANVGAGVFAFAPERFLGQVFKTRMLLQIFAGTPLWVWGLLAALVALGYSQTKHRKVGLARVAIMPVVMTALSLWGTASTFGATMLLAWALTAVGTFAVVASGQSNATYDAGSRTFAMPGSWVPMLLILAIFLVKYVSNVALAMQPQLAHEAMFAIGTSALGGVFSGQFLGRAARSLKLAVAGVRFAYRQPT